VVSAVVVESVLLTEQGRGHGGGVTAARGERASTYQIVADGTGRAGRGRIATIEVSHQVR
jgi:hypothetical protein